MRKFTVKLQTYETAGSWTYLAVPFSVEEEYGTRGQVRVKGTIDGTPFQSTLLASGGGDHHLVVKRDIRRKIGKEAGESVEVCLEMDITKRIVRAPKDLREAMSPSAKRVFSSLAPSHKKAYVEWITGAKKPETRVRRIAKAVELLAEGQKLK